MCRYRWGRGAGLRPRRLASARPRSDWPAGGPPRGFTVARFGYIDTGTTELRLRAGDRRSTGRHRPRQGRSGSRVADGQHAGRWRPILYAVHQPVRADRPIRPRADRGAAPSFTWTRTLLRWTTANSSWKRAGSGCPLAAGGGRPSWSSARCRHGRTRCWSSCQKWSSRRRENARPTGKRVTKNRIEHILSKGGAVTETEASGSGTRITKLHDRRRAG